MPRAAAHLAGLVAVVLASAGCEVDLDAKTYSTREERRFTVSGRPALDLRTFDGAIDVRAWDRPEVRVTVERRGDSEAVAKEIATRFSQDGNRITVEATGPRIERRLRIGHFVGPSARLEVTVPSNADVTLFTTDGSVAVAGVTGTLDLRSGDGSITGEDLGGGITAHSGDGSITLSRVHGGAKVGTRDGSVRIRGVLTALDVDTGDGSIVVDAADESRMNGDWRLHSGDGSITLGLPSTFDADLDARTDGGRVHATHAALAESRSDDRMSLAGRMGRGGHRLTVTTGDGSVRIRESR